MINDCKRDISGTPIFSTLEKPAFLDFSVSTRIAPFVALLAPSVDCVRSCLDPARAFPRRLGVGASNLRYLPNPSLQCRGFDGASVLN